MEGDELESLKQKTQEHLQAMGLQGRGVFYNATCWQSRATFTFQQSLGKHDETIFFVHEEVNKNGCHHHSPFKYLCN